MTTLIPVEIIAWFTRTIAVVFQSLSSLGIRSDTSSRTTTVSVKILVAFTREIAELHSTFDSLDKRGSAF